jgi:alpha-amylase/alpha-mannosidase (GH57 family)
MLPWVRLHAAKDYLDMALRLERHPRVRCTFNFVPSLLDQLDDASAGGADVLFDLLAQPLADQSPDEREEIARRCVQAPRHAFERWSHYRTLADRVRRARGSRTALADRELVRLQAWFLLAWIDPMFLDEPEARLALAAAPDLTEAHRDALLALHARLTARVVGAYRKRAEAGPDRAVDLALLPPDPAAAHRRQVRAAGAAGDAAAARAVRRARGCPRADRARAGARGSRRSARSPWACGRPRGA